VRPNEHGRASNQQDNPDQQKHTSLRGSFRRRRTGSRLAPAILCVCDKLNFFTFFHLKIGSWTTALVYRKAELRGAGPHTMDWFGTFCSACSSQPTVRLNIFCCRAARLPSAGPLARC